MDAGSRVRRPFTSNTSCVCVAQMMISVQLDVARTSIPAWPSPVKLLIRRRNTLQTDCFCELHAITVAALSSGLVQRLIENRSTSRRKRSRQRTSFSSVTEFDSRCLTKDHQEMTVLLRRTSTHTTTRHSASQRDRKSRTNGFRIV